MSQVQNIAHRLAVFLQKHNAAYCENCLIERVLIASRLAMKAALETPGFSARLGVCPDCKTRKQVIAYRREAGSKAA
jgi:hypothetical protein